MIAIIVMTGVSVATSAIAIAIHLVSLERAQYASQRERAKAYFAHRDQRHALQEEAARRSAVHAMNQRESAGS